MRTPLRVFACSVGLAFAATRPADGQGVTPVGPFAGDHSENFDNLGLPFGFAVQQLTIFGGFGEVRNLTPGGSIKFETSSSLNGNLVVCRSSPGMIGQLGVSEWRFPSPVARFGGYWENNSRFDDARVDLYGVDGALLGTETAAVSASAHVWTWNGWQSEVPIGRLVVTGNDPGLLNGFIWYDDMEVTAAPVPEPPAALLAAGAGCAILGVISRRRRNSRRPARC
jgi:hypothetical protein